MATLSPSNLVTCAYGEAGWNHTLSNNLTILHNYMLKLWGPTYALHSLGQMAVDPPPALTQGTITESTGGSFLTDIPFVNTMYDQEQLNNIHETFVVQLIQIKADRVILRTLLADLLVRLRVTTGNGVLYG